MQFLVDPFLYQGDFPHRENELPGGAIGALDGPEVMSFVAPKGVLEPEHLQNVPNLEVAHIEQSNALRGGGVDACEDIEAVNEHDVIKVLEDEERHSGSHFVLKVDLLWSNHFIQLHCPTTA